MTLESIVEAEEKLRQAVLSGRYSDLLELARLYRQGVEEFVHSLAPGDPRSSEIASRAREVLHGAVSQVSFERDLLASQLAQIPNMRCFLESPRNPVPRVRFDG